jgi:hypothetical protein
VVAVTIGYSTRLRARLRAIRCVRSTPSSSPLPLPLGWRIRS